MGYGTDGLTFNTLRAGNIARIPLFKNAKGGPAHSEVDGSDWKPSTWSNAVLGELGELANLIKKVERGDITLDACREEIAKECADVACYLDILSYRLGVDLGAAIMSKFNQVSVRVGAPIVLEPDGMHYTRKPSPAEQKLIDAAETIARATPMVP